MKHIFFVLLSGIFFQLSSMEEYLKNALLDVNNHFAASIISSNYPQVNFENTGQTSPSAQIENQLIESIKNDESQNWDVQKLLIRLNLFNIQDQYNNEPRRSIDIPFIAEGKNTLMGLQFSSYILSANECCTVPDILAIVLTFKGENLPFSVKSRNVCVLQEEKMPQEISKLIPLLGVCSDEQWYQQENPSENKIILQYNFNEEKTIVKNDALVLCDLLQKIFHENFAFKSRI